MIFSFCLKLNICKQVELGLFYKIKLCNFANDNKIFLINTCPFRGLHGGIVVRSLASQKVPAGSSLWSLIILFVGFLLELQFPPKKAFFSKPFFLFQSWGCHSLPQSHHSSLMVLNVLESMCVALLQTGNLSGCSPPSANSRWDRLQQQISQKC